MLIYRSLQLKNNCSIIFDHIFVMMRTLQKKTLQFEILEYYFTLKILIITKS
jgi:hypothetical protein